MSPLGTIGAFKHGMEELSFEDRVDIKLKQGRASYMVEMKITDDENKEIPWNGKDFGNLKVRGPFISSQYMKGDGGKILDEDGFFDTGDVATIDKMGFMQITDRSKDVIKSGGEWISSIQLEQIILHHNLIYDAAVIGLPHPKWGERPIVVAEAKNENVSEDEVLDFFKDKCAFIEIGVFY